MSSTNKIAMITGATSGIGEACAHVFAENHYNLIITGRRSERLEKLAKELCAKHNVEVNCLIFDVRRYEEVEKAISGLKNEWKKITVLVNNAGLSLGLEPIQEGSISDWETMIDTNIKGLLYVTRLISPLMIEQKSGHIINIGSIAGKETYGNGNVYCATKHAVDSLNKAMRIDLLEHTIKVTAVHPGAVETEFSQVRFKGDSNKAAAVYEGYAPLRGVDVAASVYFAASQPAHVNINELTIMPTAQANTRYTYKA